MKSKQIPESTHTTFNTVFNAPVGTAYISSTHSEQSNSEITLENIQQIESFSQGHPELEDAARAIRNAYPQKASMLEQAQKWLSLLTSVGGLTQEAINHGPQLAALVHHLEKLCK